MPQLQQLLPGSLSLHGQRSQSISRKYGYLEEHWKLYTFGHRESNREWSSTVRFWPHSSWGRIYVYIRRLGNVRVLRLNPRPLWSCEHYTSLFVYWQSTPDILPVRSHRKSGLEDRGTELQPGQPSRISQYRPQRLSLRHPDFVHSRDRVRKLRTIHQSLYTSRVAWDSEQVRVIRRVHRSRGGDDGVTGAAKARDQARADAVRRAGDDRDLHSTR